MKELNRDDDLEQRLKVAYSFIVEEFEKTFTPLLIDIDELPATIGIHFDELELLKSKYPIRYTVNTTKVLIQPKEPPKLKIDNKAKVERLKKLNLFLSNIFELSLEEKVNISLKIIKKSLSYSKTPAVAFSGGKDSIVVLHLVRELMPDVITIFDNTGVEFPETIKYVKTLAKEWNLNLIEAKPNTNFWRIISEKGYPIGGRGSQFFLKKMQEETGIKIGNKCCYELKEKPVKKLVKKQKIDLIFVGNRVHESVMRKFNLADFGAIRFSSTYRAVISWPIFFFTEQDIWDYIQKYNLPINPLYKMGYKRVGCWACMQDIFHKDNRILDLRENHPKLYRYLMKYYGEDIVKLLKYRKMGDNKITRTLERDLKGIKEKL